MNNSNENNYYINKNILVTGGASFIGSHLVELLVKSAAKVTVVDNLSSGKKINLQEVLNDVEFIEKDLRNDEANSHIFENKDVIFHLAAMHGGRGYIDTHPVECLNNMILDHKVYENSVKHNIGNIIQASSACVYPIDLQSSNSELNFLKEKDANFEEPGKAYSDGEYGWAKLMGELQLKAFCEQFKINGTSARIFTAYGERENESHAVIALIAKAMLKLDPFPIWGDGKQTRNFTYVKDTVYGLYLAGLNADGYNVLNVGSNKHHTINELCETIFQSLDWKPKELKYEIDKPVGVKSRASDNLKILNLYNWEPNTNLIDGINETSNWYLKNSTIKNLDDLNSLLMSR